MIFGINPLPGISALAMMDYRASSSHARHEPRRCGDGVQPLVSLRDEGALFVH